MQNRLWKLAGVPALKLAMWLFLAIPVILMCMTFGVSGGGPVEQMMENPEFAVQFVTALTYLFSWLIVKSILGQMELSRESWLFPLWLLVIGQALVFNLFTTCLLALGIYQEYGKDAVNVRLIRVDRRNRSVMIGLVFMLCLYVFLMTVRVRIGMN